MSYIFILLIMSLFKAITVFKFNQNKNALSTQEKKYKTIKKQKNKILIIFKYLT